jgi:hypothetical protein
MVAAVRTTCSNCGSRNITVDETTGPRITTCHDCRAQHWDLRSDNYPAGADNPGVSNKLAKSAKPSSSTSSLSQMQTLGFYKRHSFRKAGR